MNPNQDILAKEIQSYDDQTINPALIAEWTESFENDPQKRLAQNTMTKAAMADVLIPRAARVAPQHVFNKAIPQEAKVTDQKGTGRCWMFAAVNALRLDVIRKFNLDADFELSHSYLYFWDKLERANFFLDQMVATAEEPLDGRLVQFLLSDTNLMNDGGQWDMLVNLVQKYGVCPKAAMPESKTTERSLHMNRFLRNVLRGFAGELRELAAGGAPLEQVEGRKAEMLRQVHSVLLIHLGTPPTVFDWEFRDKSKAPQALRGLTPQAFYREHCAWDVAAYVSLVHDPRHPYYAAYTVERLGNVVGGRGVLYLNLPIDELKRYAAATIDRGDAVWFGCEVGKEFDREGGVLDHEIHDYQLVYGLQPRMSKAERLRLGESCMTHAMLLTAYDRRPGDALPWKWRVENSWGEKSGHKGYLLMTDGWFDEFLFQICVRRDLLDARL